MVLVTAVLVALPDYQMPEFEFLIIFLSEKESGIIKHNRNATQWALLHLKALFTNICHFRGPRADTEYNLKIVWFGDAEPAMEVKCRDAIFPMHFMLLVKSRPNRWHKVFFKILFLANNLCF